MYIYIYIYSPLTLIGICQAYYVGGGYWVVGEGARTAPGPGLGPALGRARDRPWAGQRAWLTQGRRKAHDAAKSSIGRHCLALSSTSARRR